MSEKQIYVWTNGRAVRSYTGQDKTATSNHTAEKGWYKAIAVIKPIEEELNNGTK